MIFYSEDIVNKIIDESNLDEIIDKLDEFTADVEMIFTYFNYTVISLDYIQNLLKYKSNKTAFYCLNENFTIRDCPSCMIYSKQNKKTSDEIIYYIMIISTQEELRNKGYATALLNEFIAGVRKETKDSAKKVKIVLSSIDEAVSYYQKYGFEAVDFTFDNYPYLKLFEICDKTKLYTIMELCITA